MDPYVGEIRIFAGSYAPRGWAFCNGQLVAIRQNTALFSILGVQYGGDGKTTFALPNLQGKAPMNQGNGPGLTPRSVGEDVGSSTVTLLTTELPNHIHTATCPSNVAADQMTPQGAVWANTGGRKGDKVYSDLINTPMNPMAILPQGGSQPHNNMQPYLAINYIIALEGVFPQRP
ncbi:tail fiber protein [Paenibacillus oenotherae]|uniref:Tail fiber protein n=1 Tax=Paenibacillus oenotherae TaxID=1435645 RepID=A0ABS7D860_9BACL|nr:tail fiber protein [Paenibacillus oenotherae]MBW7476070.1 tail fiber protein [Paenibacillus oenotherae]